MPNVADLLAQSRAAHAKYRSLAGKVGKDGKVSQAPNLYDAGIAIQDALKARTDAHVLDPQQLDPAWIADQRLNKGVTSDAMLAFLARYLTPVEAR